MAEESAVKVCVRVRPIIKREEGVPSEKAAPVEVFWKTDKKSIHQIDDGSSTKSFSFDRVFTPEETTNQLYQEIAKPLVVSTVQGYNGTIFAYGQTSSGKTFTMMGSDHVPGVIPLAIDGVFETIKKCPEKEFLLRVSYMEIYNETVSDLLVDSWKRKPLEVRESLNKTVYVADLTEELVTSSAQALAWIRKGEKNRHYGKTEMNERSSRSHTVFRMILESRERSDLGSGENADGAIIVSHLNLVDLAGSERASQTGAEGTRLKEGCNINRSLFTLGQVIKKLSEESQSVSRSFINYRDSKLTRILQNSLGGNAKTVILCTITTATLDETLRTLQFASTAKKMKNDPHVTEVSDDGALLKRYRTEIVDLKRRLQEVSSRTQTTATEKQVLSQLLQEKHQLQVEQEDRIRNLTKLLVTSNNLTCQQKVPKRRVTWGGKMLRLARPSPSEDCLSDRSFAASVSRKRKIHSSSVMEQIEDEDFDGDWEIPGESSDDTSQCQDLMTFQSMASRAAERVAELEVELQTVCQQNQQAHDQIAAMEQKAAEVDLKLQSERQQKSQAVDKVQLLELHVTELKLQLEEQQLNSGQQLEDYQRYESLATEIDMLASERDHLKQALDLALERTRTLEMENTALSQELEEKMELQEFVSLEEKLRKEQECELENTICSLKEAMESRELQYLELQTNLETVSEELRKKTKIADDLQNMCGKDLSKEVAKLQLSLDDSEALGRETKKEWAVLRSENIALQELKMTLTDSHEKMEAEVTSLSLQLQAEKSQFKKMQADLQKELNVVFNENMKLTSLLDGKVPRNMMESVELERTVTDLKKELAASQEAEGVLRAQVEEIQSLQAPTFEANNPEKPNSSQELEELESVVATLRAERDQVQMDLQENIDMMIELQEELRTELGEKVVLKERIKQLEESQTDNLEKPLDDLAAELETLQAQKEQLEATLQVVNEQKDQLEGERQQFIDGAAENQSLLHSLQSQLQEQVERNDDIEQSAGEKQAQLQYQVEESQTLLQSLQDELEALKHKNNNLVKVTEEKEFDFKQSIKILSEELETAKANGGDLRFNEDTGRQTLTEETRELLSRVTSLTEERDQLLDTVKHLRQDKMQLRTELEENMEMMQCGLQQQFKSDLPLLKELEAQQNAQTAETQAELTMAEEKIRRLQEEIGLLMNENKCQELQNQVQRLSEELECAIAERTSLQSEMEKLLCQVTSLGEERHQLHEQLEALGQETSQLRAQLQDKVSTMQESENKHKQSRLLQQAEARKLESDLRQEVQQLEEQLKTVKGNQTVVQTEQLLAEANATVAILTEKLQSCEQDSTASKVTAQARLRDLTSQLEELFGRLEEFIQKNGQLQPAFEGDSLRADIFVTNEEYNSFPQATRKVANVVYRLGAQNLSTLQFMLDALLVEAKEFKRIFRESIQIDATIFEEWHLQDVLRCKADSHPDLDSSSEQTRRLAELIDKRQFYVQKVGHILEILDAGLDSYHHEVSAEGRERARFSGLMQEEHTRQPLDAGRMHGLFSAEAASRCAVLQSRKMLLRSIFTERDVQYQELRQVTARAQSQLHEEKSKRVALRQKLEEIPELTLLCNNQEFSSRLQQSEEKVKALCLKNKELEETQQKNNTCFSGYKTTIQQLETELEENRGKVEELKNDVEILKSRLHESEERALPSVAELQKAQAQLYMKTMELSVASDKHQQEIQRMTAALQMKEESVRKLKESLRVLQQQGADPVLKGEELCDRFLNPRGVVIKSSAMLQNSKLEEEVKQLHVKISQLESVISSQQADVSKWKNRALKIKSMVKADIKPLPPSTPTKRGLPMCPDLLPQSPKKLLLASHMVPDSPVRQLDAPHIPLLNSPKSRFFDQDSDTDLLYRTFPRKFFDNSTLGLSADATSDACASQSADAPDCITQ
ncbi:centromere-associated protein E [Syngnathus acus]|uniref:centromere-associated protein E n=1 Tax=Syngnathus acus TaxID=161584 RepID=UPI001885ADDE|nr:centromere-associated protein E [Syngnathus acus]